MSLAAIIIVIAIGILLILLEFFVVPGITVAGIGGLLLIAGGVAMAYISKGNSYGHITLGASAFALILALSIALRAGTWNRIMLKESISSSITDQALEDLIKPGDTGRTLSRLAPYGKVMINEIVTEGKSNGIMINPNTEIIVTKVLKTNIIVKPKNS